jgi:hypothetical protein
LQSKRTPHARVPLGPSFLGDIRQCASNRISDSATSVGRSPVRADEQSRALAPRALVDAIFDAVEAFREGFPPNDDMTAVAVKITG